MPTLEFHTLDVFTETMFGGNPLAVFPAAPELPTEVMQSIAREFNLSETVFVCPAQVAGALRKLRIFTPNAELPFAGHPTIGTAQLLVELGLAETGADGSASFAFEEGVGLVPVEVTQKKGGEFFTWLTTARIPECRDDGAKSDVLAAALGLSAADILQDERDGPLTCSAGLPFVVVPVRDHLALARATLDGARWRRSMAANAGNDVYLFCREPAGGDAQFRARMFGSAAGITEDPATGSAAAAFAGYLWRRDRLPGHWVIAQGVEMGRPSRLHLEIQSDHENILAVRVGGSAVRVSTGTLHLAD